jgi:hypothetical protein
MPPPGGTIGKKSRCRTVLDQRSSRYLVCWCVPEKNAGSIAMPGRCLGRVSLLDFPARSAREFIKSMNGDGVRHKLPPRRLITPSGRMFPRAGGAEPIQPPGDIPGAFLFDGASAADGN